MDVVNEMERARLYYRGDQWLRYRGNRWEPPAEDRSRVRLVVNKLIPIVEHCLATYLRYRPIILATPASDEDSDRQAAKTAEILLRYYWDYLKFDEILVDLLRWVFVCGCGFLRVSWDAQKELIGKQPVLSGTKITMQPVYKKAPKVEVIDPFSFNVEPGATRMDDAGWCMITQFLRTSEIEKKFGVKLEPSEPDEYLDIPILLERGYDSKECDRAACHVMYERPTAKDPQGRIIYVANKKLLADPQPLPKGQVRIVQFRGIDLPGDFWPSSVVTQGIPPQTEINKGLSQLIESRNLCSRPVLLHAEGSVRKGLPVAKPGTKLPFDPMFGFEPKWMQPPQMAGWVPNLIDRANQDLMDLASRHEASQGIAGAASSGKHAAIYRSADDSRLAPGIRMFESGLQEVGRFLLAETHENMSEQDIIPITGKGREGEVFRFKKTDVSDKTNIRFEIASQIPWAREAMRNQIIYLNQIGKIDDETMFEQLELPTVQKMHEHEQRHRLNARKENDRLKKEYFPPLPTDDPKIHLEEHKKDINLPENREFFINELVAEAEMNQIQTQGTGQEPQQPQYPRSLTNVMRHIEDHNKQIPAQQPPPPAAKINLSLDRLLTNPMILQNPQLAREILPLILELVQGTTAGEQQQEPSEEQPRAPEQTPPGISTPPSGAPAGEVLGGEMGGGSAAGIGLE